MTVYLVQEPTVPRHTGKRIDISPLYKWGEVVVLVDPGQVPSMAPREASRQIAGRLAGFDADKDYLAVAGGDYVGMIATGAALANMGVEYVNFLRFERNRLPNGQRDPANGEYVSVMLPLVSLGDGQ